MKMYLTGYQQDIGIGWKQYQLNDTDTGHHCVAGVHVLAVYNKCGGFQSYVG